MKVKENFLLKKVAGNYVVIPIRSQAADFSGIIKLSETGAFLWKLLEGGAERDELVARLTDEYLVDDATAGQDVDRFLNKLSEADLLE